MSKSIDEVIVSSVEIVTTTRKFGVRFFTGVTWDFGIAWLVMLTLGVMHNQYQSVPHPGYWLTLLMVVVSGLVIGNWLPTHRVVKAK
jgi:hypothetical protein